MSYIYVATPYSKYPHGTEEAYRMACRVTALLLKAGLPVFSPIAHSHGIAQIGGIDPVDHDFWVDADKAMLETAGALLVVQAEGWEQSRGMAHEIDVFTKAGKPIFVMESEEPWAIPPELFFWPS